MIATRRGFLVGDSAAAATLAIGSRRARQTGAERKARMAWWHSSTRDAGLGGWESLADAFVAQGPTVEIGITVVENEAFKAKVTTAMRSGELADIFDTWGGGVLYE